MNEYTRTIDGIAGMAAGAAAGIAGGAAAAAAGAAAAGAAAAGAAAIAEDGPVAGPAVCVTGFDPTEAVMGARPIARTGAALGPAARRERRWYRCPPCCCRPARLDFAFAAAAVTVFATGLRCKS